MLEAEAALTMAASRWRRAAAKSAPVSPRRMWLAIRAERKRATDEHGVFSSKAVPPGIAFQMVVKEMQGDR